MRHRIALTASLVAIPLLAGCGGGGGPASTPAPVAPQSPAPSPSPTPTPAAAFDTAEYRRSDGPAYHNAVAAWQLGHAGQGVTIGIVDSGIDTTNPEFAGRISPASADVAGNRGLRPEDDHGTDVALVAAAARDGAGMMGIAYRSTILALRADAPGTCADTSANGGCRFADAAIAAGLDRASQSGAKVVNLSLGGGAPGTALRAAMGRAAAADVVVIVASGNDADEPNATLDPNNPDPFAVGLRTAGNGNVIIAGSVNEAGTLSAFANRAGSEADWYLTALGERICCVYENGTLKTVTQDGSQFVLVFSGTSFSTPQIAGAAALLRQAFPNLTAAQTVDLLLRSARDAGEAGTDPVYGRGILDIARAFAPQGGTSLAGTATALVLAEPTGATSPAMGDAVAAARVETVVLDGYGRAYGVDLGGSLRAARPAPRLAGALVGRSHEWAGGGRDLTLAFSVDGRDRPRLPAALRLSREDASSARVLAARMIAQLSPNTRMGFAFAENADGLAAAMQDRRRPAFLVAGSPLADSGFVRTDALAMALRRRIGGWGLTISAEHGGVRDDTARLPGQPRRSLRTFGQATRLGAQLDRRWGAVDLALGASWLAEDRTILGARFNPALAGRGADSLVFDLDAAWRPDDAWRVGAALRRSWTLPRGGGALAGGSHLVAQGWSFDVARLGVFAADDSLALRIVQPLRVEDGGLSFNIPIAYDYTTLSATPGRQRLSLVPRGRELLGELSWRGALWGGSASASLFYRRDPGHHAALPDEQGAALTWSGRF